MNRPSIHPRQYYGFLVLGVSLALGGCASYQRLPLPEHIDLAPGVEHLQGPDKEGLALTQTGLSLEETAALAVRNNPALKAARKRLGIARAQVYAAGLLPDPQVSASMDFPTVSTTGLVNAFGLGLNYDLIPLINRKARIESRQQGLRQINLELLWQEWQVIQQARSLAVQWVSENEQLHLLEKMRGLYKQRYQYSDTALQRGDLTLGVAGTDLTALLDTLSRINQLEQVHNDTDHALHLLMGMLPDAPLSIRAPGAPAPLRPALLEAARAELPKRRPDLLALEAGYQSQEARIRAAILSQFPSFSIGITRARDTGSVYTSGFNIGLNLPLFSGSRGAIAIERATRAQLAAAYQSRLDQTAIDISRLLKLQTVVSRQQQRLKEYLPVLERLVARARKAYQRGDIEALTFLNMETTWIGKRLEQIGLHQTQWKNRIALETLLALPGSGSTARGAGEKSQ